MAKKTFPIRGINRSAPLQTGKENPAAAQDGDCDELVNLRFKDGAWRPVGKGKEQCSFAIDKESSVDSYEVMSVHAHKLSDGREVMVAVVYNAFGSSRSFSYYIKGEEHKMPLVLLANGSGEVDVAFMGNVMVANVEGVNELLYFTFEGDAYKRVERNATLSLEVLVEKVENLVEQTTVTLDFTSTNDDDDYNSIKERHNSFKTTVDKAVEKAKREGNAIITGGIVLFRAAVELKDGSFSNFTPLKAICTNDTPCKIVGHVMMGEIVGKNIFVDGAKLFVSLSCSNASDVAMVHIYSSRVIRMYDVDEPLIFVKEGGRYTARRMRVNPAVADFSFIKTEPLYLIKSIKPAEANGTRIEVSKEVLSAETGMVIASDNFSLHQMSAEHIAVVNNRLLLCGAKQALFDGYGSSELGGGSNQNVNTAVYDKESGAKKIVGRGEGVVSATNLILCYPDIRAKEIYLKKDATSSYKIPLKEHPLMNLAYGLAVSEDIAKNAAAIIGYNTLSRNDTNYFYKSENISKEEALSELFFTYYFLADNFMNDENASQKGYTYRSSTRSICEMMMSNGGFNTVGKPYISKDVILSSQSIFTKLAIGEYYPSATTPSRTNAIIAHKNKLRATDAEAPFTFPAELTYTFDGDVLGVAQNSIPLSTGQFGSFPLLIATTAGWRAAELATDGGFIGSVKPLNGLAPLSGRHVVNAGTNVAFVAADGVYLMRGAEALRISDALMMKGKFEVGYQVSALARSADLSGFADGVWYGSTSSAENAAAFAAGATMGYNPKEEELWLLNPEYPFQYVYGLESGMWGKRTVLLDSGNGRNKLVGFAPCYPKLYVAISKIIQRMVTNITLKSVQVQLLELSDETVDNIDGQSVGLMTRGMRFDASAFKKVERLAVNCEVVSAYSLSGAQPHVFAGLYMSNDGKTYKAVDYKVFKFRALNVRWLSSGCGGKFFKLVVLGRVLPESNITTVDVETSEGLGN